MSSCNEQICDKCKFYLYNDFIFACKHARPNRLFLPIWSVRTDANTCNHFKEKEEENEKSN